MKSILIVEDEPNISDFVKGELEYEGYDVCIKEDGREGLEEALRNEYDLIILDVMLPSMNGFEICRRLKREKQSPVIMLSAKDSVMDKVNGLQIGADDYITKPFSITEVMARIKANIRRNTEYAAVQPEQTKLVWGPLVMNLENHTVIKSGEIIELTAKEFDILRLLLENPQRVYTKAQIYSLIWNDAYMGDENAVNVHISRLRTKIEDDPRKPQVVITVWGIGYKLGEQK